ncbi:unnamed protein product [Ectocarpus sp. CCAP 1310/34]|nr:unnamed protein product [Ectocarpus sp. CCAP 1310/34]
MPAALADVQAARGSDNVRGYPVRLHRENRRIRLLRENRRIRLQGAVQAVDSPDGIIRQLWDPLLGRRHDVTLLGLSGRLETLMQSFNDAVGVPYYIHGDPAYQVTVEWGFGRVVALWPYVDYVKKQQVALSACGLGKQ